MKKLLSFLIISLCFIFSNNILNAQCKTFAKKECKLELIPYVHDGVYNATILSEGESAELFKTFYSGQEYRIAICTDANLPKVEFQVLSPNRQVLFSNKDNNYANVWDFKLQSSQQLIISIQIPTQEKVSTTLSSGCVAVLIGFLNVESSFDQFK